MSVRDTLDRAVRARDAWRRSPLAAPSAQGSYKEWLHFCVRLPGDSHGYLLVNLNVTERSLAAGTERRARVIALAHAGEWRGRVESVDDGELCGTAGDIDVRFGASSLRFEDGVFELLLRTADIGAHLRLHPAMLPTGATSVALGDGHAMQWVAVARLAARGEVAVGAARFQLEDAPAYHDHNWGQFRWGAGLSWDWGYVHPADPRCPWNVLFVRVSEGAGRRTLNQFALVWRGERYVRAFLNQELTLATEGAHAGPRPLTVPGVMGLLSPGAACGVPAATRVRAAGLGDELALDYHTGSKARVVVPSETHAFRSVLLNETEGSAHVRGRIGGEAFDFDGSGIVEFVRG